MIINGKVERIRTEILQRNLQQEADFHKAMIDVLLDAKAYWEANHSPIECPLTKEAIIFISRYLYLLYNKQNEEKQYIPQN